MQLLLALVLVLASRSAAAPSAQAVAAGQEPVGWSEAAAPLPRVGLVPTLELSRTERREAFVWLAPAMGDEPPVELGYARREVLRIAPGQWRVQVRERWGRDGLETHSVERLGLGTERRLVERELRTPSGRTVFARWSSAALAGPVEGALQVTTSGEGRAVTRVVDAAPLGLPALGRPALVELLRRGLAPERCLALEPYSGRFEAARLVQVGRLPGFPGMRLAMWISEEPGRAGELCRWWLFSGADLAAFGGPAGTAMALRTTLGRLPEGLQGP